MTLDEAHLELLDHLGEDVAVGIMLPGSVPFAGGHGVLDHAGQRLRKLAAEDNDRFYFSSQEHRREEDRTAAERLLNLKDWGGHFMVDTFSVPLEDKHVTGAQPTEGLPHPGLDFTIEPGGLTVRVTFLEHDS